MSLDLTPIEAAECLLSDEQAEANLLAQAIAVGKEWAIQLLDPGLEWQDYRSRWAADTIRLLLIEGKKVNLIEVSTYLREHPEVVKHPQGPEACARQCLSTILAAESARCTESEFLSLLARCKSASLARKAKRIATTLQRSLSDSPTQTLKHIAVALNEFVRLTTGAKNKAEQTEMSWPEAVAREVALINEGRDREGMISTPIEALNHNGGSCFGGQLVAVCAQPKTGKTTFALQWARHVARTTKKWVYFEECEMAVRELARRGICSITGKKIENTTESDRAHAITVSTEEPTLHLCCTGGKLKDFLGRVHRWILLHPDTVAIFVDYVGLLQDHRASVDATTAASEVSDALKNIAQHYQVLVVALQQPNRKIEARTDKTPLLSDIRDSPKLVQDAHKILFLSRPYAHDKSQPANLVQLHLLANRDGPTGVIDMAWSPETFSFSDWDSSKLPLSAAYTPGGEYKFPEEVEFEELEELEGIPL